MVGDEFPLFWSFEAKVSFLSSSQTPSENSGQTIHSFRSYSLLWQTFQLFVSFRWIRSEKDGVLIYFYGFRTTFLPFSLIFPKRVEVEREQGDLCLPVISSPPPILSEPHFRVFCQVKHVKVIFFTYVIYVQPSLSILRN